MAGEFDGRVSEKDIVSVAVQGKSAINVCKNTLASVLVFAGGITAADITRLGLTQGQKDQLTALKAKFQAVHDAIVAEGF